jgi:AcrR family transcriptional regulator
MAPRGRPRNAQHDEVILRTTMELLTTSGYRALTMDAIATAAGVGRPALYRRWPSKPAVVVAALAWSSGLDPAPDTGTLEGDLLAVQRRQVKTLDAPATRRFLPALIADLGDDPELARRYVDEYLAPRRASVARAVDRAKQRGELDPDVDPAWISDLLTGPLWYRAFGRHERLHPSLATETVRVVLAAYGRRAAEASATTSTTPRVPSTRRR